MLDLEKFIRRFLFLHMINTAATIAGALTAVVALVIAVVALVN